MQVKELVEKLELTVLANGDEAAEVTGGYSSDLLSWVMAHGVRGGAWITVQTHMNIIAVASLLDMSCIIIPEGIDVDESVLGKAAGEGISILSSAKTAYELSGLMYGMGIGASEKK